MDDRLRAEDDPPEVFRGQVRVDPDEKPPLSTGEAKPPPPQKSS
jgi:hypothetical protein